ncbi:hypothetical protein [Duganella sp. BJB1802]|uniref:hypothetical protein n=1 Tax=Duganella sp. BJB1802 TaxID=2744575 RepID=UPI001E4272A3|nr:hypothetical protein [Duganella sp. BJB1802]
MQSVKNRGPERSPAQYDAVERVLEQFTQLVEDRLAALARGRDREKVIALGIQALSEARASLTSIPIKKSLPATKLKASDVISQGLVSLSQATLYRAAENGRFYFITPRGRSIGREFPAWQFIEPVPELIEPVLHQLENQPSSEIHAFWVGAVDDINELSPAELLAGKPFETRIEVHESQRRLLSLPASERLRKVQELAELYTRGMADIIG